MSRSEQSGSILKYKLLYTGLILLIYVTGRCIPLYGIDLSARIGSAVSAEELLMQTIGGDRYRSSVLALGISPYMISSLVVQIAVALRDSDARAKLSPRKINRIILGMTLGLALFQAFIYAQGMNFTAKGSLLFFYKVIAVAEMVAGAMLILWLSDRNKRYGIGGQTALIYVNILDGILSAVSGQEIGRLGIPIAVSLVMILVVVVMENAEKRIPVQRISIHNIYADKNYLAIKLNPAGVMPVMFSTAFFTLPRLLIAALALLFPEHPTVLWWLEHMTLTRLPGIIVYLVMLYILTVGFSLIFIAPKDMTEQFLKSGDSILNLHAGRDTKRYLTREVLIFGFLSATVMGACLGVSLILQMEGMIDSALGMLPSSVMMLTGIWCNLYREIITVRNFDAYHPFL